MDSYTKTSLLEEALFKKTYPSWILILITSLYAVFMFFGVIIWKWSSSRLYSVNYRSHITRTESVVNIHNSNIRTATV